MSENYVAQIDNLIIAEKHILGVINWSNENGPGDTRMFRAALAVKDDTSAGLFFHGRAAFSGPTPWMVLTLTSDQMPIDRLKFRPTNYHTNKAPPWAPDDLKLVRCPPGVTRRYAWADNRVYPHDHRFEIARIVDIKIDTAEEAILYMQKELKILGDIPYPKHQPSLGI